MEMFGQSFLKRKRGEVVQLQKPLAFATIKYSTDLVYVVFCSLSLINSMCGFVTIQNVIKRMFGIYLKRPLPFHATLQNRTHYSYLSSQRINLFFAGSGMVFDPQARMREVRPTWLLSALTWELGILPDGYLVITFPCSPICRDSGAGFDP